jgi:CheY-like chemotaxis protein
VPGNQILIVEDDPLVAQDLKDRLESLDYKVAATTGRAEEALGMTQRFRPDLVLMDLQLSGAMDGIQAAGHRAVDQEKSREMQNAEM